MATLSPLSLAPHLLTTEQAATLLNVSSKTILNWIGEDRIPYVRLPGGQERAQYRIPLDGLVASLSGTFDLGAALRAGEEHVSSLSSSEVRQRATPDH